MIVWAAIGAALAALAISALATPLSRSLAARFGFMDLPGGHKGHPRAVPVLGGSPIFLAFLMPTLLGLSLASYWSASGVPGWLPDSVKMHVDGAASRGPMALGILGFALVLHVMGLIDDRRGLGPWLKLGVQLAVAAGTVLLCGVRVWTAAGALPSVIVSVVWLVAITNAFNFLDNMDGLSAGVAAICAAALLGASASIGQWFVSAWLSVLLGALLGFLPYNFHPASTFMGDAGALVVGYLLAVASCLTTYVAPGQTYYLYGFFVPLVLMAVPLYDMASVVILRLREGRNPMVGDRRHFSHRLLERGMGVRKAVLTIYLCTAGTAISASLLAHVADTVGAVLVFAQTAAIILIVAVLESREG